MPPFLPPLFPQWIWSPTPQPSHPDHQVVCFRRTFQVDKPVTNALIHLTADARYELYLNGHWLGHGPIRSWPSPWPVDEYDLRGLLHPGTNTIAILVQHYGLSTFQYLHAQPGLIAQLHWQDATGSHQLITDSSWRTHPHQGFLNPVSRISCMQGWEEQYDARATTHNWQLPQFDDRSWNHATITGPMGSGVHQQFVARPIPMLTRDPIAPVRVLEVEAVRPPHYTWSINPRAILNPTDKTANFIRGNLLLITHLHSPTAQAIEFHQPHDRPFLPWKLNGQLLAFDDFTQQKTVTGVAHARLRAGRNTLMAKLPETEHYWWAVLNVWTKKPVQWGTTPNDSLPASQQVWQAIGPFGIPGTTPPAPNESHQCLLQAQHILPGATMEKFAAIWAAGQLSDTESQAPYVQSLPAYMVVTSDIYAQCAGDRVIPNMQPQAENLPALQSQNAQWTTLYPNQDGSDLRVLLDFGREVIGFHEFEIDAPAGTIVDNHNFEFIQPDGRYNLAEGMNNSFRYICHDGVQHYRTMIRRGFRYSWFTFRNFHQPIRIRSIRLLMSTYPQARQGSFTCSDPLLDRIWEAGAHSVACCSEDTYTDCPSYEQSFWVGDARNEALIDLIANGDPRLSAHAWQVAAQSLDRSPLVEGQVPSGWQFLLPAWSFLWMRWAQEHYQLTGDNTFAHQALLRLKQNIAGIQQHLSPRGLFKIRAWNMFDWAPMDTPHDGEITHLNCLAIIGLRQAAQLAKSVRAKTLARKWHKLADQIAVAVNTHLWDTRRQAYIDCIHTDERRSTTFSQQTHTVAYMAGVPTGKRLTRCQQIMRQAPRGFVQAGSPFYMFFLLEGLAQQGELKTLVEVMRSYWGQQIEAGATTFWESYHPEEGRMTRSHCHGWSAAPTFFLSQYILGIKPLSPGYAKVEITPPHGVQIRWARGSVPTPRGVIQLHWEKQQNLFALHATLPDATPAIVQIPTTGTLKVLAGKAKKLPSPRGQTRLECSGKVIQIQVIEHRSSDHPRLSGDTSIFPVGS